MDYSNDEASTRIDVEGKDESTNIDTDDIDEKPNKDGGCCYGTDNQLLVSKLFYLFFSSAFGCVTPYLALYFKQIFISPRQLGIIVAIRSFVQFIFAPILSSLAERYNKRLCIILVAILAYAACYLTIPFIPSDQKPPYCQSKATVKDGDIPVNTSLSSFSKLNEISMSVNPALNDEGEDYYYLPWSLFYAPPVDKKKSDGGNQNSVKLSVTDANKHLSDTSPLYISILLVITVGYIFGSPAQTLADIATLQSLGVERSHEYGRQALFGSVGYGIVSFVVGASVSKMEIRNPCNGAMDTNYLPCFICFGVLMVVCFFVTTAFRFPVIEKGNVNVDSSKNANTRNCATFESAVFIFVVFFCGTASGFIGTFLLWHIHELGGPQLLFSFVILFNSAAEVLIYHLSHRLVTALGYSRVVYLGLICYGIRFFYYSYCETPWLFLPIELIQGITSAAVWSAFVYYVSNDAGNSTTLQGVVSGVYGGLGYAAGGLVGGILVHELGTSAAFLIFGQACLVVLCFFIITTIIAEKRASSSGCDQNSKENLD